MCVRGLGAWDHIASPPLQDGFSMPTPSPLVPCLTQHPLACLLQYCFHPPLGGDDQVTLLRWGCSHGVVTLSPQRGPGYGGGEGLRWVCAPLHFSGVMQWPSLPQAGSVMAHWTGVSVGTTLGLTTNPGSSASRASLHCGLGWLAHGKGCLTLSSWVRPHTFILRWACTLCFQPCL